MPIRFVVLVVEPLNRCLVHWAANLLVDVIVLLNNRTDGSASGLIVDGEEARLPTVIGLNRVRVVVQARAE